MAPFRDVCRADEILEGKARRFMVDGTPICVFRWDGELYAMDDRCPHGGASLAEGIIEDGAICCRIHHWRFALRDGACLSGEKPECDARPLPVRIRGDRIQVRTASSSEERQP